MTKRQFSDADKAAALAALDANGGNVYRTAKQLDIPRSTLQRWIDGRLNADVPQMRQQKKGELSERLDELAHTLIDTALKVAAKDDASIQQLITSLGIVIDKQQLLKGKPTEIVDDASLTDEQRASRIAALLDRARARRDGRAADGGFVQ